jgi:DNA-binding SARP family transcriptional activator
LRCSRRQLEIDPSVRVDVEAVSRWADRLIDGTPESNDLEFALTPDMFTLLAESDGDWLVVERERFRQRILHAADRLIDLLCDAGSFARALDVGLSALAQEPLRESTNLAVMRVHLREGNRSEAVRHYERCCALLRSELSVEPSEALRCLAADAHAR